MKLLALLRNFTIRTRMIGAIAIVLGMFALVGAAGLLGGLKLKALNAEMMHHSLGELRQISAMRTHLSAVRLHEQQMVIDYENSDALVRHREHWTAAIAATRTSLEGLLAGEEDDDNPIARAAITQLGDYEKASQPVLQQIQNGGYDNARVVDKMLARAKAHVGEVEAGIAKIDAIVGAEAQATEAEFQQAMQTVLLVFVGTLAAVVVLVVPLTLLNSHTITRPIGYARTVAQSIAAGDLTRPIRVEGRDEASQLLQALQQMQQWLQQVVGDVRQSSANIEIASREVASGNTDLSARTEQAASSLQETASSMAQLNSTVRQSADAARQASEMATTAADVAQRGGTVVAQVVSTMDEINTSSRRIADIIGTIDGIAFQTNILALNAAVEAARAGEQGRGFAVVASEVRSLAQRSAEAAREIKALIGASVERVESGSKLVADAGSTMAEIVASVQRVSNIIGEVTAASEEQSQGIGQVNGAVVQLDRMTQQNAALVEQSATAAESLKDQADRLASLVTAFRLDDTGAPTPGSGATATPAKVAAATPRAARAAAAATASSDADWKTF
jgi:methyl-accepting chemotaxis protein